MLELSCFETGCITDNGVLGPAVSRHYPRSAITRNITVKHLQIYAGHHDRPEGMINHVIGAAAAAIPGGYNR